jgi:hypothetical protein
MLLRPRSFYQRKYKDIGILEAVPFIVGVLVVSAIVGWLAHPSLRDAFHGNIMARRM